VSKTKTDVFIAIVLKCFHWILLLFIR